MTAFVATPVGLVASPPARLNRQACRGGSASRQVLAVATAPAACTAASAIPGADAGGASPPAPTTSAGAAAIDTAGAIVAAEVRRGGLSRRAFLAAALASAAAAGFATPRPAAAAVEVANGAPTFFDLTASRGGAPAPLRDLFDGKVTLVVNVASYCALTPQYEGLVALHRKYAAGGDGKRPFDIAAFPCNQFAGQEPGTYDEVCAFAREKFGAEFTLFDPLSVNGPGTHPVYQWLKANNPDDGKRIEWNFAKFLVDADGAVVRRYKPGVLPEMIEGDVAALVAGRPLPKRVKPQLGAA
ncbi:hypothetical protein MMPV_006052 [Pyropia vietnamensis]